MVWTWDEDWVKKVWSIELKEEDRLEDQEGQKKTDMAELEIHKEDVHDRNVMKRKSNTLSVSENGL